MRCSLRFAPMATENARRIRRRRRPEDAEREILDAAEALFTRRPVDAVTIDEVMSETGLTRQAFYAYFRDRHHLVARVVGRLAAQRDEVLSGWEGPASQDPVAASRAELTRLARFYRQHGELLRALAEGARHDPGAGTAPGDAAEERDSEARNRPGDTTTYRKAYRPGPRPKNPCRRGGTS